MAEDEDVQQFGARSVQRRIRQRVIESSDSEPDVSCDQDNQLHGLKALSAALDRVKLEKPVEPHAWQASSPQVPVPAAPPSWSSVPACLPTPSLPIIKYEPGTEAWHSPQASPLPPSTAPLPQSSHPSVKHEPGTEAWHSPQASPLPPSTAPPPQSSHPSIMQEGIEAWHSPRASPLPPSTTPLPDCSQPAIKQEPVEAAPLPTYQPTGPAHSSPVAPMLASLLQALSSPMQPHAAPRSPCSSFKTPESGWASSSFPSPSKSDGPYSYLTTPSSLTPASPLDYPVTAPMQLRPSFQEEGPSSAQPSPCLPSDLPVPAPQQPGLNPQLAPSTVQPGSGTSAWCDASADLQGGADHTYSSAQPSPAGVQPSLTATPCSPMRLHVAQLSPAAAPGPMYPPLASPTIPSSCHPLPPALQAGPQSGTLHCSSAQQRFQLLPPAQQFGSQAMGWRGVKQEPGSTPQPDMGVGEQHGMSPPPAFSTTAVLEPDSASPLVCTRTARQLQHPRHQARRVLWDEDSESEGDKGDSSRGVGGIKVENSYSCSPCGQAPASPAALPSACLLSPAWAAVQLAHPSPTPFPAPLAHLHSASTLQAPPLLTSLPPAPHVSVLPAAPTQPLASLLSQLTLLSASAGTPFPTPNHLTAVPTAANCHQFPSTTPGPHAVGQECAAPLAMPVTQSSSTLLASHADQLPPPPPARMSQTPPPFHAGQVTQPSNAPLATHVAQPSSNPLTTPSWSSHKHLRRRAAGRQETAVQATGEGQAQNQKAPTLNPTLAPVPALALTPATSQAPISGPAVAPTLTLAQVSASAIADRAPACPLPTSAPSLAPASVLVPVPVSNCASAPSSTRTFGLTSAPVTALIPASAITPVFATSMPPATLPLPSAPPRAISSTPAPHLFPAPTTAPIPAPAIASASTPASITPSKALLRQRLLLAASQALPPASPQLLPSHTPATTQFPPSHTPAAAQLPLSCPPAATSQPPAVPGMKLQAAPLLRPRPPHPLAVVTDPEVVQATCNTPGASNGVRVAAAWGSDSKSESGGAESEASEPEWAACQEDAGMGSGSGRGRGDDRSSGSSGGRGRERGSGSSRGRGSERSRGKGRATSQHRGSSSVSPLVCPRTARAAVKQEPSSTPQPMGEQCVEPDSASLLVCPRTARQLQHPRHQARRAMWDEGSEGESEGEKGDSSRRVGGGGGLMDQTAHPMQPMQFMQNEPAQFGRSPKALPRGQQVHELPTSNILGRNTHLPPKTPKLKPRPLPSSTPAPAPHHALPPATPSATPTAPDPLSAMLPKRQRAKVPPGQKAFLADRAATAQQLYDSWNAAVFKGRLPPALPLVWNPRLVATAGQVVDDNSCDALKTKTDQKVPCRLELSSKVLTSLPRLRTTLAHEMCHVAAWALDYECTAPHGPAFWKWAKALMAHDKTQWGAGLSGSGVGEDEDENLAGPLSITRLHSFETHQPHRWQCTNSSCNKVYQRHRNSISCDQHVCSQCKGKLFYLGKFGKNNQPLRAPATPGTTAAGDGLATPGKAQSNAYNQFVKAHFSELKSTQPPGTPSSTVMKLVAKHWAKHKLQGQQGPAQEGQREGQIGGKQGPQLGLEGLEAAGTPAAMAKRPTQLEPEGRVTHLVLSAVGPRTQARVLLPPPAPTPTHPQGMASASRAGAGGGGWQVGSMWPRKLLPVLDDGVSAQEPGLDFNQGMGRATGKVTGTSRNVGSSADRGDGRGRGGRKEGSDEETWEEAISLDGSDSSAGEQEACDRGAQRDVQVAVEGLMAVRL